MPRQLWSVETAREMGKRSAALAAERRRNRLAFVATEPLTTNGTTNQTGIDPTQVREVAVRVLALMLGTSDHDRLASLERCFSGLFEALCTLTGTSRPGPRKPAELRTRGVASLLGLTLPVEAQDAPTGSVCAQPAGHIPAQVPDTQAPEYS